SHGDYGEGGFREFKRLIKDPVGTSNMSICISDESRLSRDASVQEIENLLQTMVVRPKSVRVYVLFLTKEDARKLLQAVKKQIHLYDEQRRPVLIASDAWGKESSVVINGETDDIAAGTLTIELISKEPSQFDHYFNSLKPTNPIITNLSNSALSRNPWFNEFWEHRFGCSLKLNETCYEQKLNETNWDSKLQFIVDAVHVFAHALHRYLNCSNQTSTPCKITDINGTKLFDIILNGKFD
ncbi:unnamed protein product, partial [Didymodactylos carnosus]